MCVQRARAHQSEKKISDYLLLHTKSTRREGFQNWITLIGGRSTLAYETVLALFARIRISVFT